VAVRRHYFTQHFNQVRGPRVCCLSFLKRLTARREIDASFERAGALGHLFSPKYDPSRRAQAHAHVHIIYFPGVITSADNFHVCVTLSMSLAPGGVCVFLISNYGIHIFRNFGAIPGPTP
jgi:hypothetical protein